MARPDPRNDSDDINAGIPWPGLTHRTTAIALRGGCKANFIRVNRATCDAVERPYSLAHPRELPGARLTYPVADCGLHPVQSPTTRKQTLPPLVNACSRVRPHIQLPIVRTFTKCHFDL